jgi:hypothetical protein
MLEKLGVAISVCGPQNPKCWGRRFGIRPEGPRTGFEYDTRDPSMTKLLWVFRIATRAL